MLILSVAENLDKLFENGCLTAVAPLGKLRGIVVMAINIPVMLVVAILGSEDGLAQ